MNGNDLREGVNGGEKDAGSEGREVKRGRGGNRKVTGGVVKGRGGCKMDGCHFPSSI